MTVDEILTELVGHCAYDTGCRDSGVHDLRRQRVLATALRYLMQQDDYRALEARWFRDYWLSEEAIAQGYGMKDVLQFCRWLENDLCSY